MLTEITITQDGGSWRCAGPGFVNLQESINYAFGDTPDAALSEYRRLYVS